ncbi:MAG: hypothetical protein GXP16_07505 [Gammaproteobacteria bacterium]|nr:hypothetical protein [Gammaproteobacteria bacterium]
MNALSADQIRAGFSFLTQQQYMAPKLEAVDWAVLDYFGWIHPSGHRGFVAMPFQNSTNNYNTSKHQANVHGLYLRRYLNQSHRPKSQMCSWCHHVYRGRGTAMFSTEVEGSHGRRIIGNYICHNLDCSLRIRNLASDPPTYLPETIDLQRKVTRLHIAVKSFMSRANVLADNLN